MQRALAGALSVLRVRLKPAYCVLQNIKLGHLLFNPFVVDRKMHHSISCSCCCANVSTVKPNACEGIAGMAACTRASKRTCQLGSPKRHVQRTVTGTQSRHKGSRKEGGNCSLSREVRGIEIPLFCAARWRPATHKKESR